MSDMTKEQRASFKERLAEVDAELAPLYTARQKACEPFDAQIDPLEERREAILEEAEAEVAGNCEGCEVVLFFGDKGQHHCEASLYFCEECSPTWSDCLAEAEASKDEHYEEPGDREAFLAVCRERVEQGKGDEKNVWEL